MIHNLCLRQWGKTRDQFESCRLEPDLVEAQVVVPVEAAPDERVVEVENGRGSP